MWERRYPTNIIAREYFSPEPVMRVLMTVAGSIMIRGSVGGKKSIPITKNGFKVDTGKIQTPVPSLIALFSCKLLLDSLHILNDRTQGSSLEAAYYPLYMSVFR